MNLQAIALANSNKKLEDIIKAVKEDYMPLNSYLWIHKDAILTPAQKGQVIDWATVYTGFY